MPETSKYHARSATEQWEVIIWRHIGNIGNENRNEAHPTSKRKHDEDYNQSAAKRKCNEIDDDELDKMLEEITIEYDRKIALGKRVYKILEREKVKECALPKDMQEALDIYRRNVEQFDEKEKEIESEDEK